MLGNGPNDLCIVSEVEQHIAYLINKEGFYICVLEEIIMLDVYLQGFSLISRVLGVED